MAAVTSPPSLDALRGLAVDAPLWQAVVDALTVGETNFFRQPGWFAQLEAQILRPVIERRRRNGPKRLRIWSAGCASGEETYSLAILVQRLLGKEDGWDVSIVGTDLSVTFLGDARRAVYREWSLRDVDYATRLQHFTRLESGRFELIAATRERVSFAPLNLADEKAAWTDPRLTDLDLILCRNVLMYLAPERQRAVAQRLIGCLAPDGWLATAPAEATAEWFRPLTPVNVPSAVLFRHAIRRPRKRRRVEDAARAREPRARSPRRGARPDAEPANTELSDSAAALAGARRALDSSIRRLGD